MMAIGRVADRVDLRLPLLIGFVLVSLSLAQMSGFTDQASRFTIVWTGFVQGLGFVCMPLGTLVFAALPVEHRTGRLACSACWP